MTGLLHQDDTTDADRWRTLINSPFLQWLGSAGFDFSEGRFCAETEIIARNDGQYMHIGVNIFSHPSEEEGNQEVTLFTRKLLTVYVDTLINQGKSHAANGTDEFHGHRTADPANAACPNRDDAS